MGKKSKSENGGETKKGIPSIADSVPKTVHSMQSGVFELYMLLRALRPTHVVMYDIEMSVVRQLEVYQANHPAKQIKVSLIQLQILTGHIQGDSGCPTVVLC